MVQLRWTTAQVRFLIDRPLDIIFALLDLCSLNNSQVLKKIFSNNESMERLKKTSTAVLVEGRVHSIVICLKKRIALPLSSFLEPAKRSDECEQRILVWKHCHHRKEWIVSTWILFFGLSSTCQEILFFLPICVYTCTYIYIYVSIYSTFHGELGLVSASIGKNISLIKTHFCLFSSMNR